MKESKRIQFSNYEAIELIHESDRTLVYRGNQLDSKRPVVIKFMRNPYPSFSEFVQFRNQYTIAKNLTVEGIVKPYALERYENRYAFVMEDFGGCSLSAISHYSISEFLDLAIQLVAILHELHKNCVIHKDIKPDNILIHPKTRKVKLIDFSISTLLPKETQSLQTPNILEGTLPYLSPEQTGRMNRGIDYRSDFYALGVTFYKLLAGKLPFESDDPLELVHCHMAKAPEPIASDRAPAVLSDIVLKLMAKNAEDRYQSALGLKYDLEKCLAQYRATGEIEAFELGARDVCDRFLIPEKLYGREAEVQALLDAFVRVASPRESESPLGKEGHGGVELMLVAGFSGIGKTAAINEVHKPITRQKGYFIRGKFDQFNRNIPFSAFVQAFRGLMGQLLGESDIALAAWKTKILAALGENGRVIIDVIPELERIVGAQPPVPELSGSAAQNRFNLLFGKFVRVFATREHPLVIFLDDLQWADSASSNLLKLLVEESETGYLLILGAYRDNEVYPTHPLLLTLDEIEKGGGKVETLTLAPLSESDINQLVADTLLCEPEVAAPFSESIYQKTRGNPFFTTQFLQGLHEEGCIAFNAALGYWQCNMARVRQLALTDDVVAFMVGRLRKLSDETQEVLKLAACIGNRFDLATLAVVCEGSQETVAADLWQALQEGFTIPESQTYKFFQGERNERQGVEAIAVDYRFLHDRVQQAAYSLITEEQKQNTHLYIGTLLLEKLSTEEREERLFEIVNHLNIGKTSIADPLQKEALVDLNLSAGRKAKAATAYAGALSYIQTGMELLPEDCWERCYEVSFSLCQERAELEFLNGNSEAAQLWIERALERARTAMEKAEVYNLSIVQHTLQAQYAEAIDAGRQALALMGIELPEKDFETVRDAELAIATQTLQGRSFASLAEFPWMDAPEKQMAIKLLITLGPPTYRFHQRLWSVICAKAVNLCLNHGNTPEVGYIYPAFGGLRGYALNTYQGTDELLDVTIQLTQAFHNKSAESVAYLMIGSSLRHWSHPLKVATEDYLASYRVGLESSNLQYAAYAFGHNMYCRFYQSVCLEKLVKEVGESLAFGRKYKNQWAIDLFVGGRSIFSRLMGADADASQPSDVIEEADYLEKCRLHKNWQVICIYNILKTQLLFLLERFDEALECGRQADAEIINVAPQGLLPYPRHLFIYSLLLAALYSKASEAEKIAYLEKISTGQKQLEVWARNCPGNFLHLYCLVKAENARISGDFLEAIELYDRAIAGAKENEYTQEEALANELAAKFYLDWGFGSARPNGKDKIAGAYMQEAYYSYARWGAKAKTDDLEKRYPQLLAPILERQKLSLTAGTSITTPTRGTIANTSTEMGEALDFASFVKAARTLSEEIDLDRAIANLMQVVRENAGAETVALMLFREETLMLEAIVAGGIPEAIDAVPVRLCTRVPLTIVNTVRHARRPLVLANASQDNNYAGDPYIQKRQPQSVLCAPLVVRAASQNRGKLIGILYLENNQVSGAFTSDRVEVLDLLCSQAAVSLENARLYRRSQQMANNLQQALDNLQQAQLQLVQNEKMATLGGLVAGVAHEINNPVGFIGGNVSAAQEHLQDLLDVLALYRENASVSESIAEEIEAFDTDFIAEDFPKLIASMQAGCDRITSISTSLRTFSRTDTGAKTEFNLHDGIDSTLLILKYRLKANEARPAIEILKNYGDIPAVQCYPGQLNQVFMNILANAIDALDESNAGKSFQDIENQPNCITIATELSADKKNVIVRISDNGSGIPEAIKAKIFEQGFTTKEVGKGTGLGMAIARQIVVEKHGGAIDCYSKLSRGTEFAIFLPLS